MMEPVHQLWPMIPIKNLMDRVEGQVARNNSQDQVRFIFAASPR